MTLEALEARVLGAEYDSIYEFYSKGFFARGVLKNESLIFDEQNIWTKANLKKVLECFDSENLNSSSEQEGVSKNFWTRLAAQFREVQPEEKKALFCLTADLIALHYVFTADAGKEAMGTAIEQELYRNVFGLEGALDLDFSLTDKWSRASGGYHYNLKRPYGMCYLALVAYEAKVFEERNELGALQLLFSERLRSNEPTRKDIKKLSALEASSLISRYPEFENAVRDMLTTRVPHFLALLHLAAPRHFFPIVSGNDVKQIIQTFGVFRADTELEDDEEMLELQELLEIKSISESLLSQGFEFKTLNQQADYTSVDDYGPAGSYIAFYDPDLKHVWHDGTKPDEETAGLTDALKIKKQIILYGPPGTGKTHNARELAGSVIFTELRKLHGADSALRKRYDKDKWKTLLNQQITEIQVHPNMGYEDFIGGLNLTSENGATTTGYKKGIFWDALDTAKTIGGDLSHFVILDEINRTDLSRMMGECLSRLEYRDMPIPVPNTPNTEQFEIPNNLYIIGTMNEIDHSLERIDFAMRRRFIWVESNFDADALQKMLSEEPSKESMANFTDPQLSINDIVKRASDLNSAITSQPTLGKKYCIGHSYFSDIRSSNICILTKSGLITNASYKKGLKLLWEYSLRPILESYEPGENTDYMETFKTAFLGEKVGK